MTASDLPAYVEAGHGFMQRMRDPEFRSYLQSIGWAPGQDVVVALDDEPIVSLLSRLAFNEASSPCLIAFPRQEERFGYGLMLMAVVPARSWWRRRHPQGQAVSPQASVGMLYSSLTRCDAYLPSEWVGSTSMTLSRVPAPA